MCDHCPGYLISHCWDPELSIERLNKVVLLNAYSFVISILVIITMKKLKLQVWSLLLNYKTKKSKKQARSEVRIPSPGSTIALSAFFQASTPTRLHS